MDNFSRAIISSALSPKQDLTAYLIVLYSAIRLHGAPEALVSDNVSIFKAKQAMKIYELLGIRKELSPNGSPGCVISSRYVKIAWTFCTIRAPLDFHPT